MLRRAAATGVAVGLLGLTGCGVSGTDFRPGVAAQVGDERLYVTDVDDTVDGACGFLRGNDQQEERVAGTIRAQVAQALVERSAMEQLLDERGLEPDPAYRAQLAELEPQLATLPEKQRDDLYTINEAAYYVQGGQFAVGQDELGPGTDPGAAQAEGTQQLAAWMNDNGVEVNPVFGFSADDVTTESVPVDQQGSTLEIIVYGGDADTSVAQSDEARDAEDALTGAGQGQDGSGSDYVAALPSRLKC